MASWDKKLDMVMSAWEHQKKKEKAEQEKQKVHCALLFCDSFVQYDHPFSEFIAHGHSDTFPECC
tara:strand:- start:1126 stop:1320 length:195 start_codon:yes stop_codon:yes gene_type:complete